MRNLDPENKLLPVKAEKSAPANVAAPLPRAVARAIQALERGDATKYQQQSALTFIINQMSRPYNPDNWQPGGGDLNDFAQGRAFVGHQILGALKVNLAYFAKKENK